MRRLSFILFVHHQYHSSLFICYSPSPSSNLSPLLFTNKNFLWSSIFISLLSIPSLFALSRLSCLSMFLLDSWRKNSWFFWLRMILRMLMEKCKERKDSKERLNLKIRIRKIEKKYLQTLWFQELSWKFKGRWRKKKRSPQKMSLNSKKGIESKISSFRITINFIISNIWAIVCQKWKDSDK